MDIFLKVLGTVFFAELGDKTQFLMIAMASKYRLGTILAGVGAAICALNLLAIALGTLIGGILPTTFIGFVAGLAFLCFAYMAIGEDREEKELSHSVNKGGFFTVFGTFFLAELGDKTQLTALTLAASLASEGFDLGSSAAVFAASSIALFAADVLGLVIGYCLGKTLPSSVFSFISFGIFSVFGIVKILGGFEELFSKNIFAVVAATSAVAIVFALMTIRKFLKTKEMIKSEGEADTTPNQ